MCYDVLSIFCQANKIMFTLVAIFCIDTVCSLEDKERQRNRGEEKRCEDK